MKFAGSIQSMNRQEAKKRVLKEFEKPPPKKTVDWFIDGYMAIHGKPKKKAAISKPKHQQLKLF